MMIRCLVALGTFAVAALSGPLTSTATPLNFGPPSGIGVSESSVAAELVHDRSRGQKTHKHRHADGAFILRQPDYGELLYYYDRRVSYPYRCVPRTAAQFYYCRERYITFDPATGAWITYAPYAHLCYCT